jgi:DnaJ-class molecular chaperone
MLTISGMMYCPRCHGSTWDPNGGDCHVCDATGVLTSRGERVSYEEASDFIRRVEEQRPRRMLSW